MLSLDSGKWEMVLPATTFAAAMFDPSAGPSGRLLIVDKAAGIRAAPFDAARPAPTSADTSVLANVNYETKTEAPGPGWLCRLPARPSTRPANRTKTSLVWVGREGKD